MDRNKNIDNLRGLAMLSMMVIHASSYYLKDKVTYLIWNYLQWAVPVFIFCSFYLFFSRDKQIDFRKRLTRLFVPYYIFLGFYFLLLFFFEQKNFNLQYFFANVFLYKGVDFNWLVLLFFYFTFLMPVVSRLKKNKVLFYSFFALSLFSSIYFIFRLFNYRAIMWLPWTTYMFFAIFFIKNEKNKKLINLNVVLAVLIFLFLNWLEIRLGHNLSQFANKYPPTLFHLSYGIFSTVILYRFSQKGFFDFMGFDKMLNFLSINSYSLYFIHILMMFVLIWTGIFRQLNWPAFFLAVFFLSVSFQKILIFSQGKISRPK